MNKPGQAKARLPFHESVIGAIYRSATLQDMRSLATLIKETKIPKGHDRIIRVWLEHLAEMGWGDEIYGVVPELIAQKEEATQGETPCKRL